MMHRFALLDEGWVSDGGQGEPEWEEVSGPADRLAATAALAILRDPNRPRGRYKRIDRENYCQEVEIETGEDHEPNHLHPHR